MRQVIFDYNEVDGLVDFPFEGIADFKPPMKVIIDGNVKMVVAQYSGAASEGELPTYTDPIEYKTVLSLAEFYRLFTATERKNIKRSEKTDETVEDFIMLLEASGNIIDMKDQDTIDGINYIESINDITLTKRDIILLGKPL